MNPSLTDEQIEELAPLVSRHAEEHFRLVAKFQRDKAEMEARQLRERDALAVKHQGGAK